MTTLLTAEYLKEEMGDVADAGLEFKHLKQILRSHKNLKQNAKLKSEPKSINAALQQIQDANISVSWAFIMSTEQDKSRRVENLLRDFIEKDLIFPPRISPPKNQGAAPSDPNDPGNNGQQKDVDMTDPVSEEDKDKQKAPQRNKAHVWTGIISTFNNLQDPNTLFWKAVAYDPAVDICTFEPKVIVLNLLGKRGVGTLEMIRLVTPIPCQVSRPAQKDGQMVVSVSQKTTRELPDHAWTATTETHPLITSLLKEYKPFDPKHTPSMSFAIYWRLPGFTVATEFGPIVIGF
ncbi:hypothetical protein B0H16DRAFT_147550 [Mycena metata]|uniref:Uncharacterized protein n=1 Tax=Mycena metata TaxID=1033252 RepID=A0AAD7JYV5_9AGAR|nr:hypothetical protein B0H16DRAFT_147550 [Mycena metata]